MAPPAIPLPRTLWQRLQAWCAHRSHQRPTGICLSRRHELLAQLQSLGPLRTDRIDLPGHDVPLWIRRTADYQRLLSNAVYDPAQDVMPHWAEIWPSGVVLAGVIAQHPHRLQDRRVLELGPGVGVTAVAALQAGADLVVADAAAGSLALCAFNTLDQAGVEPTPLRVNWRTSRRALMKAAGEGFSLVLAADTLYHEADVVPLLVLVERLVTPGGELWLADPGRAPAKHFVNELRRAGWRGTSEQVESPWPDPQDQTIDIVTVYRLRRPADRFSRTRSPG